MSERRLIPSPAIARDTIDTRLRALGLSRTAEHLRSHAHFRDLVWQTAEATVTLHENHVLGERWMVVVGDAPAGLDAAMEALPRATLLQKLDEATDAVEALPWLRRLSLLERGAPSAELQARLRRFFADPALSVRTAATSVLFSWPAESIGPLLDQALAAETNELLKQEYTRIRASIA